MSQLVTLATALEVVVSRGFNGFQAAATMKEVAERLRQIEQPAADAAELAALLRRAVPYLEWIDKQSPWPQPLGLLQEIRTALGINREDEK